MSKYICDYNAVMDAGSKLCDISKKINLESNKYYAGIDSDLANWTGVAKDSFTLSNNSQFEIMRYQASYLNALGEYVKKSSERIETLDSELSKMEI